MFCDWWTKCGFVKYRNGFRTSMFPITTWKYILYYYFSPKQFNQFTHIPSSSAFKVTTSTSSIQLREKLQLFFWHLLNFSLILQYMPLENILKFKKKENNETTLLNVPKFGMNTWDKKIYVTYLWRFIYSYVTKILCHKNVSMLSQYCD